MRLERDTVEIVEKRQSFLENHSKLGESFFLCILATYIIGEFLIGTTYVYVINESIPYYICLVACILAVAKILVFNNFSSLHEFALITILGLFIWSCSMNANTYSMIYYYILIIAAKNVDLKKILKLFIVLITVCLALTFLSAKLGIISGLTNLRDNSSEIRYALGMDYPTDLAARIFYLELFYMVLKKFKFSVPEYIIWISIITLVYIVTDTRLDVLLMVMLLVCCLFKNKIYEALEFIGNKTLCILMLIATVAMILMTYAYTSQNIVLKLVNKALSGRLFYGKQAFIRYNVTFFGQWVPQEGNGGIHKAAFEYFYIDSSFIRILMMQGLICFILIILTIGYLSNYYMSKRLFPLEIALIFMVLSSIIDQHLMEVTFNCLFLTLLADKSFLKMR